jgi:hypothetical protein
VSGDHRLASRAYGDGVATTPVDMGARLRFVAGCWAVIGGGVALLCAALLSAQWLASHGVGWSGVVVLTEVDTCHDSEPPQCDWSGEFVSDDGRIHADGMRLSRPLGAQAGDTVPADMIPPLIMIHGDTSGASPNEVGLILAVSSAVCLVGLLPFQPWTWRRRFRERRSSS